MALGDGGTSHCVREAERLRRRSKSRQALRVEEPGEIITVVTMLDLWAILVDMLSRQLYGSQLFATTIARIPIRTASVNQVFFFPFKKLFID